MLDWVSELRWRDFFPWWRRYNNEPNRATYVLDQYGAWLIGDVLDVGCGTSAPIYKDALGKRYHGLDRAGSHYLTQADTLWDVEKAQLPFRTEAFDTVLCIGMLEHCDNPHEVYDECFRVARCYVLVQLPNNWPGFIADFLVGHHFSHCAGYGLPVQPRPSGQRHKWFFNFAEASDFLTARIPEGWRVASFQGTFEKGNDTWLTWPAYQRLARYTLAKGLTRWPRWKALLIWFLRPWLLYPLQLVDWLIGLLIWGWRGRVVYHNLFCREVWVLYERQTGTESNGLIAARSVPIRDVFPVPIVADQWSPSVAGYH